MRNCRVFRIDRSSREAKEANGELCVLPSPSYQAASIQVIHLLLRLVSVNGALCCLSQGAAAFSAAAMLMD